MQNEVTILSTDKQLKAINLCDYLTWAGITFRFEKVGVQYTVTVSEKDVPFALGGC